MAILLQDILLLKAVYQQIHALIFLAYI